MQVFHTAGVPPRSGRIILPTMGSTRNSKVALVKSVSVNTTSISKENGRTDHLSSFRRTKYEVRSTKKHRKNNEAGAGALLFSCLLSYFVLRTSSLYTWRTPVRKGRPSSWR